MPSYLLPSVRVWAPYGTKPGSAELVVVQHGLGSLRCTGHPCTPEGTGEVRVGLEGSL